MKITLKLTSLILALSFLTCLCQFNTIAAQKNIVDNEFGLPADMGDGKTVLLVQLNGRKSYDKHIRKHMDNEYRAKYDYLTVERKSKYWKDYPEIEDKDYEGYRMLDEPKFNGKFDDVEKYRYFIGQYYDVKLREFKDALTVYYCNYYILDRVTNEKYICPIASPLYAKLFKKYIRAIEGDEGK